MPSGPEATVTVRKPAMEAVAGLVPCDESGTMTSSRACVAAAGVPGADDEDAGQLAVRAGRRLQRDGREAADLAELPLQPPHQLAGVPCASASGASGCRSAKPGRRAAHSLTLGLYFMVHEPSG